MSRITLFCEIILPLSVPRTFTYRVPLELNNLILPGQRAIVQFGKNKLYTGLVAEIHENPPSAYQARYLEALLDEQPIVNREQLQLWQWISQYYCCHMGEVMIAGLPASLKLASETRVLLSDTAADKREHLSEREITVFEALHARNLLSLTDISEILEIKTVYPVVKSMLEKGVIVVEEELREKYKVKTEEFVRLSPAMSKEEQLRPMLDSLSKAPRQLDMAMTYLHLTGSRLDEPAWIKKTELQQKSGTDSTITRQLVKKGLLESAVFETDRLRTSLAETEPVKELSPAQQKAFDEIAAGFREKNTVLLHGVTSSGKTEIYFRFIQEALDRSEQVLYLLPEIALTTQLIGRLQKRFGGQVGVYHSRFNPQERAEVWHKMLKNEKYRVLVGARSAVFLPFTKLGLIIVDEEHETSFKQYEPAPRYQARDTAVVLGSIHKAPVLLGSATPSIETYWQAVSGRYGLVELHTRFGDVELPEILVADTKKDNIEKKMRENFSSLLIEKMEEAFEAGEQVILFQNRRGYSPRWQCESCTWTPMCRNCDISLTYHKSGHRLTCHYCGTSEMPPRKCPACGSHAIKMVGFGTEKIEETLTDLFPGKKTMRMDHDTTRSKNAYSSIIADFENREIDILVGTQMVTKGLDFDNVGLVGIMDAGQMLYFPDFRAYERAFQLMAQVSGRAGRKKKRGKVVIQSNQPEHWVIRQVVENAYRRLFDQEINERKEFRYPPFYRLINIIIKHADKDLTDKAALFFATLMRSSFGEMVLGPEYSGAEKIRNLYQKNILLKFPREMDQKKIKERILSLVDDILSHPDYKPVRVVIDVDPY